jgi:hypothetical protein
VEKHFNGYPVGKIADKGRNQGNQDIGWVHGGRVGAVIKPIRQEAKNGFFYNAAFF